MYYILYNRVKSRMCYLLFLCCPTYCCFIVVFRLQKITGIENVILLQIYTNHCCKSERVAHVAPTGFFSLYMSDYLPYVRRQ